MEKKLVLFGAGNIGRSFIGQLFSRAGYEIVFSDINGPLIQALNEQRRYRVIIKRNEQPDETMWITNVRGVNGNDREAVAEEIADASVVATAVGKGALPYILPTLAQGLVRRREQHGARPIDVIMAENIRNVADFVASELKKLLPEDYDLAALVGLVETSIGKMVPIMRAEDVQQDPLWIFAEEYNELILDKHGFKNPIPDVPGFAPKDNMRAFVDRKLFIHNLGHAATAYLGYQQNPDAVYLYEPLESPELYQKVRACMMQAAVALNTEYPDALPMPELIEHIDDLLGRFQNRALGDTIFRVGRDISRKIDKDDRLVGAMLLAEKHNCPNDLIADAVLAACQFRAHDEHRNMFNKDQTFVKHDVPQGLYHILTEVCHLSPEIPDEAALIDKIRRRAL